jgi:hypothetical protein
MNLTSTSQTSRPVSLFSASNEYLEHAAYGQCDQEKLVDGIRVLLSFYFSLDETAETKARQIALFVKDMADFSDDCAFWALDEWRKKQDRRPTPASLRQLAMTRKAEAFRILGTKSQGITFGYREPSEAELAERARQKAKTDAMLADLVKRANMADARPRVPHWSETPESADWRRLRERLESE